MNLKQVISISGVNLLGDGITTSTQIDLTNYIKSLSVLPNIPYGIYSVNATSGVIVSSSSITGNILSVIFSTAPTNNLQFGLGIQLTF